VYTCSFVDSSSCFFIHLEMYMYKSVNFFPWYPRSLSTIFLIHFVLDGVGKNLIYECLFIFYCFFLHSYLVNLFGLNFTLISILILLYSFVLMFCFKWYRGSEDSIFVHIVFKCNKNSNLCMNLGSFLISFKGFLFLCPQVVSCTQFSPAR
jgi:hypothetical protein